MFKHATEINAYGITPPINLQQRDAPNCILHIPLPTYSTFLFIGQRVLRLMSLNSNVIDFCLSLLSPKLFFLLPLFQGISNKLLTNYDLMFPASQCPPLPETPHTNATVLNGGGRSYGTIVRFECEPGYVRSGHPVILCMSNGTWSNPVPTCSRKYFIITILSKLLRCIFIEIISVSFCCPNHGSRVKCD